MAQQLATVDAMAENRASRRLTRGEWAAILGFWLFMAVLTAANRLLDPRRPPGLQPVSASAPIALALVEALVWAAVTPFVFLLVRRAAAMEGRRVAQGALIAVGAVGVSMVVDGVFDGARAVLLGLPGQHNVFTNPVGTLTHLWFLREMIVYCGMVAAGVAREYSVRYRVRQEEAARLQAETAQLQAQLAEARLQALRSQIDPHFLFNTLNAVSALVERDPRGVRRMIARLSELLRHSLEGAAEPVTTLRQEMEFADRYLEIMRIRFQGSLEVETRVDEGVLDALVPSLVLQPLVENAVKHGVGRQRGVGRIEIEARREGGRVVLCVRDNGPGLDAGAPAHEGVGVRNTRERLAQLYGDAAGFALRPAEGGGVVAEVSLPWRPAEGSAAAPAPSPVVAAVVGG